MRQGGVGGNGDGELDVVLLGEGLQPIQELLHLGTAVAGNDLAQRIDEDMGNIIVTGIQTVDQALHALEIGQIKFSCIHQANLIMNIIGQLWTAFNGNHVSVLGTDRRIDEINHLLGLTGTLEAHDYFDHLYHSFFLCRGSPQPVSLSYHS